MYHPRGELGKEKHIQHEPLGSYQPFQWSYFRINSMATGSKFISQSAEMSAMQSRNGIGQKKSGTRRWISMVSLYVTCYFTRTKSPLNDRLGNSLDFRCQEYTLCVYPEYNLHYYTVGSSVPDCGKEVKGVMVANMEAGRGSGGGGVRGWGTPIINSGLWVFDSTLLYSVYMGALQLPAKIPNLFYLKLCKTGSKCLHKHQLNK